ncbi:MAG: TlpA family protein disulfide reductase [Candidatus Eisenbacteria bacterium]|nr:TlpA family protein disulfide reductase [Candidatus Eisenbacteria bacterium]
MRRSSLATLLAAGCILSVAAAAPRSARAGEVAPPFTIHTLDGKSVRLSDLHGRPVILDFWATWCGPCRSSMPHLSAMQSRYRDRGLVVIGVSMDDEDAKFVRHFADRMGLTFRVALAEDPLIDAYGPITALPTAIYIGRDGRIVRRVVGYIDAETMEAYVRELF